MAGLQRAEDLSGSGRQVAAGRAGDDYCKVRRAIQFLTDAHDEQPGLVRLAEHIGLSVTQCQKLFTRWCGLSPKGFQAALSLDRARAMLAGASNILEASHEAGLSGGGRLHDLFVTHEAMTPGDYKRGGEGLELSYGVHKTPFGEAIAVVTARGLAGLAFVNEDAGETRIDTLMSFQERWRKASFVESPARTQPFMDQIFGRRGDQAIRLVLIGTDFELRVWETLMKIPMGRAASYGDIAQAVGRPGAARAVGRAVGHNPISFVVPCHRVLRSDGGLGGYHWGLTRKRALIGWEAGRVGVSQG